LQEFHGVFQVNVLKTDFVHFIGLKQRPEWGPGGTTSSGLNSAMKDCILLAACGANETLPQDTELPADVFTSCLTTPIKIALRW
jgi:regulator-associated protein of mTOR